LVATLAVYASRFKLRISANLWENLGDGFLDSRRFPNPAKHEIPSFLKRVVAIDARSKRRMPMTREEASQRARYATVFDDPVLAPNAISKASVANFEQQIGR